MEIRLIALQAALEFFFASLSDRVSMILSQKRFDIAYLKYVDEKIRKNTSAVWRGFIDNI